MKKSEIRKDYLLDRYVIIAPKRSKRPEQMKQTSLVTSKDSPFTSNNLDKKRIIDSLGKGSEKVVVINNLFPAVTLKNKRAYGVQEVIIDTPDPTLRQPDFSLQHLVRLLTMCARRVRTLMKLPKINYILCLKNEGAAAGASIQHEHSQIFATSFVSPGIKAEAEKAKEYFHTHGASFYSNLIKKEMKSARRVYEDKYIAAFTPYASVFEYEIWIFSKRAVDNISALNKQEIISLAKMLQKILGKLKKLGLAYNYLSRQIVSDKHQHFCLKIEPRGSVWGPVELDSGLFINSVTPEDAAKYYRSK